MNAKDPQGRKWLITINNSLEKGLSHKEIKEKLKSFSSLLYWCMSDEKGEAGTYHTHLFIMLEHATRFSTVKKQIPGHIDRVRGSVAENRAYVQKSGKWAEDPKGDTSIPGTFEEWGTPPEEHQGARTDLAQLYEMIKDGRSTYEIIERNPDHLLHLDKIDRTRQMVQEEYYRKHTRDVQVTYIYGPTATGKTTSVYQRHGYENVYRVTNYKNAFDGYGAEDILVLDEYASNFPLQALLNYLDIFPVKLPARYNDKVACYTQVYIISNLSLRRQYVDEKYTVPEVYAAFLRRIQKVEHYTGLGSFTEYTLAEYLDDPFIDR